jgi:hypothetical protein
MRRSYAAYLRGVLPSILGGSGSAGGPVTSHTEVAYERMRAKLAHESTPPGLLRLRSEHTRKDLDSHAGANREGDRRPLA